ncbi:MAG: radical SAM protein, partial [Dehalococcoidales bacterium]|nr:radical SAM protein [Dehalococcoidales bacterium]
MLSVALINAGHAANYPQPPLGLALIAAVLEKAGYRVSVYDAAALRLTSDELITLVKNADIAGFSAMTPTVSATLEIIRKLKMANPKLTTIMGGPHVSLLPEETLAICPEIEIAVRGEGEETIIELLHVIETAQPLDGIAGISFRSGGKIMHNALRSRTTDMDSLPFLAYHLLPLGSYRPHPPHGRSLPFASVVTSRGCPYHCAFCSKPIFGNKYRAQSPQRVADEISYLREKFGVREVAFYDDVFTLDKKRTHAIAEEFLSRKLKFDWTCETRVNLVDKELLRHMKRAGCYAIAYGIESAAPEML